MENNFLLGKPSWYLKFKINPISICKQCSTKSTIQWHQQNVSLSLNEHSVILEEDALEMHH